MGELEDILEAEESFEPSHKIDKNVILGIILMCLCLVNISICAFMAFVIKCFKKLHLEFYTCYILHCCIIMSGILILVIIIPIIFLSLPFQHLHLIYCVTLIGSVVLLSGQHILHAYMAIDFAFNAYDTSQSQNFRPTFSKVVIAVYVYIIFFGAIVYQILCYYHPENYISVIVEIIAFGLYCLTIITVGVNHVFKRIKYSVLVDTTPLKIASSHLVWIVFCFVPIVNSPYYFMFCAYLCICHPLIIFMLCYFCDINFGVCVIEALKCNCKKYRNAGNIDDTITVVYHHQSTEVNVN